MEVITNSNHRTDAKSGCGNGLLNERFEGLSTVEVHPKVREKGFSRSHVTAFFRIANATVISKDGGRGSGLVIKTTCATYNTFEPQFFVF